MRSRLEASWAGLYDEDGISWLYEPRCFANEKGQYLPDFQLWPEANHPTYVEVKPESFWLLSDLRPVMEQMEIIWDSHPNATLILLAGNPHDRSPSAFVLTWCGQGGEWESIGCAKEFPQDPDLELLASR